MSRILMQAMMCVVFACSKRFAHSWLASVHKAGISYYLIAALDEYSNVALPPIGATQCFSATVDMPESGGGLLVLALTLPQSGTSESMAGCPPSQSRT